MGDNDYAKYVIKKYIPFKNNGCRDKFISRYNNSNDKDSRTNKLVDIIINLSKNNNTNTIVAEPVNKIVDKPTKPKVDSKQNKQLKEQIKQLKEQLIQSGEKEVKLIEELANEKNKNIDLQEKVKEHKKYEDMKKNEINRLNKIIDTLPDEYKFKFIKPVKLGIACLDTNRYTDPEEDLNADLD